MGYEVLIARDGIEASEIFGKQKDSIDLIILDMIMPNMGGGETFDRVKQMKPEVRVILSSGYSLDGQAAEIMKRGCDGFIQKPFNVMDLSHKVREVLDKKK
jgi:CheY-like chemotaxis protein